MQKSGKIKIAAIIFILVLSVSLIFILRNVEGAGEGPVLWKRTPTTEIWKNPDGTYTRTIGQGVIFVDDESRRIPNYVPANKVINMSFDKANGALVYSYKSKKNEYNVTAKIGFVLDITQVACTSQGWTWLNVGPGYCGVWANQAYSFMQANGIGKDVLITDNRYSFKYGINLTSIPSNYQDKIAYIGLRLEEVNGLTWDDVTLDSENQQILIKNKIALGYDDLLRDGYTLTLWDKKTVLIGNVSNKADLWLDPTLTLQTADTENLADVTAMYKFIGTEDHKSSQIKWNVSSVIDSYILDSTMCLYLRNIDGDVSKQLNLSLVENYTWTESVSVASYINMPLSGNYLENMTNNDSIDWTCVNVTSIISTDVLNSKSDSTIRFHSQDFVVDYSQVNSVEDGSPDSLSIGKINDRRDFEDRENSWGTGNLPYLNITYTPYIDINSPTPSQTFTQDEPTAEFNVTVAVAMDTCVWSPDSGATNYSLTNTSAFAWNMTNITMVDGSYTNTVFYCNQSDDGTWRTSDTVDFEVDSVNVTVCRDLTINDRLYHLQKDISSSDSSCLVMPDSFDNIGVNLNSYKIETTGSISSPIDFDSSWDLSIYNGTLNSSYYFILSQVNSAQGGTLLLDNVTAYSTFATAGILTIDADAPEVKIYNSEIYLLETTPLFRWASPFSDLIAKQWYINTTIEGTLNTISANSAVTGKFAVILNSNVTHLKLEGETLHNVTNTIVEKNLTLNVANSSLIANILNTTYVEEIITSGNLSRQWYWDNTINDTNGNLENAQVDIYDKDGNLEVSILTDANGQILRQELAEYFNHGGTKFYDTPHTVNVSKMGYVTNTTTYNLSDVNNVFHQPVLELANVLPTTTLITPANNSWQTSPVIFNCSATDTDGLQNITLYLDGVNTNSSDISGTSNSTTFSHVLADGNYNWTCLTYDNFTTPASDWADSNWTLNVDSTNPTISYGAGTENTNTNFSRNWIYVNTSWTEINFQNITFYLYNDTDTVNTTTYSTSTFLINFTDLIDNNYTYEVNITDKANNQAGTGRRTITIDDTLPVVTIVYPIDGDSYNNGTDFNFNYTFSDNLIGIDSCWYTNDTGLNNYSTTCGQNFTQNLSEGTITYVIYSNDTLNNIGSDSATITFSFDSPSINLNSPTNNQWFNSGTNLYFNYTATDSDGLDTCELWGNWTTWHKNYTWVKPESAVMNWTQVTIPEGNYFYNIWCNDTVNNGDFSPNNFTFHIDETNPVVIDNGYLPATIYNDVSVTMEGNSTDSNLGTSWIEINRSGTYENITYTSVSSPTYSFVLSSTFLSNGENVSWKWWANDSAGNLGSSVLKSFVVENRNPYNLTLTNPANDSYTSLNSFWINFTATDDDADTLNFSVYNSTDGSTFSLFNSTTAAFLNFSGYNTTENAVNYFYVNVSDGTLSNKSDTFVFTIDTIFPTTISIETPDASPTVQCSLTNIELNYSVVDTNIDYCTFNVTFGEQLSTAQTTISGCSNTSFNLSFDNGVQLLSLIVFDKAGNTNSTSRLIYADTDNAVCPKDTSTGGSGGGTPKDTEDLGFIGDGICQDGLGNRTDRGETFFNAPEDCAVLFTFEDFNLDTAIFNCFKGEGDCIWKSSPGLLLIFVFVGGLLTFTIFFEFAPQRKGVKKFVFTSPLKKRRRRRR